MVQTLTASSILNRRTFITVAGAAVASWACKGLLVPSEAGAEQYELDGARSEFPDEGLAFVVARNERGDEADVLVENNLSWYNPPSYERIRVEFRALDKDGFAVGQWEAEVVGETTGVLRSGESLLTTIEIPVSQAVEIFVYRICDIDEIDPRELRSDEYPFETVKFGSYPQGSNEPEPIEWLVLDEKESRKLLLAKYALDCRPYNIINESVTWERCTLREWLNVDFLNDAFTDVEQEQVMLVKLTNEDNEEYKTEGGSDTLDRVFLLSLKDVEIYFGVGAKEASDELICCPTDYADKRGASIDNGTGGCRWWLRSPGDDQPHELINTVTTYAACVDPNGYVYSNGLRLLTLVDDVLPGIIAVRPALWVSDL